MNAPTLLSLSASLLMLAGCATRISEPVSLGQGVYTMLGSTLGFMTSTSDVMDDVERHASAFCTSSGGKELRILKVVDTIPPELVRFPEGRLHFRCVTPAQDVASTSTEPG